MLLSLEAAAKELGGISLPTLRRRIHAGEIQTVRVGRRVLISRKALEQFIRASERAGLRAGAPQPR